MQLESILDGRHRDATINTKYNDPNKMSLSEKITLWNSRATAEGVEDDNDDGDEDESINFGGLSTSISVTSESRALDWLAARLRNRSLMQWYAHGMEDPSIRRICRTILAALPADTISRTQPPQRHQVSFRVEWGHIIHANSQEWMDRLHTLAITVCSGEVQVTSLMEYVSQIWPWNDGGIRCLIDCAPPTEYQSSGPRGERFFSSSSRLIQTPTPFIKRNIIQLTTPSSIRTMVFHRKRRGNFRID